MLSLYTARCDNPVWVTETGVPGSGKTIQPIIIYLYDTCCWPNCRLLCVSELCFTMKLHVPLGQFPKPITQCILIRACCIPASYALSTSRASSLELVYSKQPILGLTQEICLVDRRVAFETIKLIHAKVLCIFYMNYHPNIAHINMQ